MFSDYVFTCYDYCMDEQNPLGDQEKSKFERESEMIEQSADARAELKAKLDRGEISGAEYNRAVMDLMVLKEEKKEPQRSKEKDKKALIIVVIVMILSAIPAIIYLSWRFYFQNSLTANMVPNYYNEQNPTINSEPVQIKVEGNETGTFKGREIGITYKYYYDIAGVVTSVKDYWNFDDYDSLVPRDVCIAWGELTEAYYQKNVEFSQGERNCKPKVDGAEIDDYNSKIIRGPFGNRLYSLRNFSNNHLIPSTADIRGKIFALKPGEKVRLSGYLVRVRYGRLTLDSSSTREDTGNGACEVFYVTNVDDL